MKHSLSQTDLALPSSLGQTKCLNKVLPPRTTSLFPSEVLKMLLSLVDQDGQVALVDLVRLASAFKEVGQCLDLCCQNGDLDLAATCVGAGALGLLCIGTRVLEQYRLGDRRFGGKLLVGLVATKGVDAALDVDAEAVLGGTVGQ